MKGRKKTGKKFIAFALAVLTFASVFFQNDVQAEPKNLTEPFQKKEEAVQTENEKEEFVESEEVSEDIEYREPFYDPVKIYQEAQEIGVGFAEPQDTQMYTVNPRWNKWDERYAGGLIPNSEAGIQIDIVTYNPTVIHKSWREGVLGFKNKNNPNDTSQWERAFCAAPGKEI